MRWILCKQTLHDSVRFISSEAPEDASYLGYYRFIEFISTFSLIDFGSFKEELNKFKVLFINIDDHIWEEYKADIEKQEATFEDLLSLNENKPEENTKLDKIKTAIFKHSKIKTYAGLPIAPKDAKQMQQSRHGYRNSLSSPWASGNIKI
jgi:hypothetical protein